MTSNESYEVYIQNLPYDISEADLAQWCSNFGQISSCKIVYDKNGQSRGFGFVIFTDHKGVDNFFSKCPHSCKGRYLRVRRSNNRNPNNFEQQFESSTAATQNTINFNDAPFDEYDQNDNEYSGAQNFGFEGQLIYEIQNDYEATLESIKTEQENELTVLKDLIEHEKKRLEEAIKNYRASGTELAEMSEKNRQLKQNLVRNVVQTFNIRQSFGRQIKEATS